MKPPNSRGTSTGSRRPPQSSGARHAGAQRRRARARKSARRGRFPAWLLAGAAGLLASGLFCAGLLWFWGRTPTAVERRYRRVDLGPSRDAADALAALEAAGLTSQPGLLRLYQLVWRPLWAVEPGVHWVSDGLAPTNLLSLLARSRNREAVRVTLPEGWDSFQMAERLANAGVCEGDEFLRAVFVGPAEETLGESAPESPWSSFEGRLYPAAYDFRLDSAPSDVVARLVAEADKRHRATFSKHGLELTRLRREVGLSPNDIVTLASIVEKEAANRAELPLVASVFLNRLRDPDFRPARALQSDPTAAYGCKRDPALNSCRQFTGKVTASMLRDRANAFNTYRHSGLPPTPIGNPSDDAIEAVLTAPATDYLFFVSPDGGPHRFSRTLAEHERHLR